jgi:hypothetical protein
VRTQPVALALLVIRSKDAVLAQNGSVTECQHKRWIQLEHMTRLKGGRHYSSFACTSRPLTTVILWVGYFVVYPCPLLPTLVAHYYHANNKKATQPTRPHTAMRPVTRLPSEHKQQWKTPGEKEGRKKHMWSRMLCRQHTCQQASLTRDVSRSTSQAPAAPLLGLSAHKPTRRHVRTLSTLSLALQKAILH